MLASIVTLDKLKIDDPVGAISVHGVAGMYGLLMVPASNAEAGIGIQLLGLLCIIGWVFTTSIGVWLLLRYTVGVRVDEQTEYEGVDLHECGLEAYPEFTVAD